MEDPRSTLSRRDVLRLTFTGGAGFNGYVHDVVVSGSNLFVSGNFTTFNGSGTGAVRLAKLAASNGAAKRLLEQGGVSVNKRKLSASDRHLPASDALLTGGHVVVGKGKRDYALLRVRD